MDIQTQLDLSFRVLVAAGLVALLGFNREHYAHPAGLRTHILIGIGASLFTALSLTAFGPNNPGIVAAQIVTGIGFLGSGSIVRSGTKADEVRGITTAAGIWTTAAIGMACGAGLYFVAICATLLSWFVFEIVRRIEPKESQEPSAPLEASEQSKRVP